MLSKSQNSRLRNTQRSEEDAHGYHDASHNCPSRSVVCRRRGRSGKVANVILGVGGILGLGEHYVAVAFDKLKWVDQPVTSTTASTTSAPANAPATTSVPDGTTRTTTGAATTTTTTTTTNAGKRWYPDHAVYNATKDELKAMPEFRY